MDAGRNYYYSSSGITDKFRFVHTAYPNAAAAAAARTQYSAVGQIVHKNKIHRAFVELLIIIRFDENFEWQSECVSRMDETKTLVKLTLIIFVNALDRLDRCSARYCLTQLIWKNEWQENTNIKRRQNTNKKVYFVFFASFPGFGKHKQSTSRLFFVSNINWGRTPWRMMAILAAAQATSLEYLRDWDD